MSKIILALWCGICVCSGSELLRNADFKLSSSAGIPLYWSLRGNKKAFHFNNGVASFKRLPGKKAMLIQNRIPVKRETDYVLLCKVMAPKGARYMIYYESLVDKKFTPPMGVTKSGNDKWTLIAVDFRKPAKATSDRLLIRLLNDSSMKVRDLRIVLAKEYYSHGIWDIPCNDLKEVLYNGNFERGARHWKMMRGAKIIRTTENLGNMALALPQKNSVAAQRGINVDGNKEMRLTFFAKASGSIPVSFKVYVHSMADNKNFNDVELIAKPGKYQRFELRFKINSTAKRTPIDIICKNLSNAGLQLDEFYLDESEIVPIVKISLYTPTYRDAIYASSPTTAISGKVTATDPQTAKLQISLAGSDKLYGNVVFKSHSGKFSFPVASLPDGKYSLIVRVFDHSGKIKEKITRFIYKYPHFPGEITIDRNRNIRIDGQRFFPLAMLDFYDAPGKYVMAYAATRSGINTIFNRGVSSEIGAWRALERARLCGVKCILSIAGFGEISRQPGVAEKWRKIIDSIISDRVKKHPALLMYEYGDEAIGNDMPDSAFAIAEQIMIEKDPYHPVFLNESPRGTILEYLKKHARNASIFGVDIYPVPESARHSSLANKSLSCVGDYTRLYSAAVAFRKPVMLWLQAFDHGELGQSVKLGLPDYETQRFMNFDALLNGVSGIIYYNDGNSNQDYYNYFFKTVSELYQMEKVVKCGDRVEGITAAMPIMARGYNFDNNFYLIILNRSANNVNAAISGLKMGKLFRLDIPEKIILNSKTFEFMIKPFSVAIFSTTNSYPQGELPLPIVKPELEKHRNDFFTSFKQDIFRRLGGAKWIWYPGEERKNNSTITADKTFTIPAGLKKAEVFVTVDNSFELFINGRKALAGNRWTKIYERNVTAFLRTGANSIRIKAHNVSGKCGIVFRLVLYGKNKTVQTIISDGTWLTNADGKKQSKAFVLGDFGGNGTWTWMRMCEE
jgi:hypothetical protein